MTQFMMAAAEAARCLLPELCRIVWQYIEPSYACANQKCRKTVLWSSIKRCSHNECPEKEQWYIYCSYYCVLVDLSAFVLECIPPCRRLVSCAARSPNS
jgi:hypothetical protein